MARRSPAPFKGEPKTAADFVARGAYRLDQGEDALSDLEEAIRLDPGCAEAYAIRGNYRWLQNNFEAALADAREALRLDPNLAVGHRALGTALDSLGRSEEG